LGANLVVMPRETCRLRSAKDSTKRCASYSMSRPE
jgi:hypothetical protein